LATVASEGAINLIWQPNVELDLGGYLVLRGEAPGDTLQPLTAGPIVEARYRDASVTPGVRYVYAVVAVDNRFPVPNVSAPSEPAPETAR
jgi:fibronectin type 3 domain-containing protein